MRAKARLVCVVGSLATLVIPEVVSAQNLLSNGGFEQGPISVGPFLPLNPGALDIDHWKVTRGQIDLIESAWISAEGSRSLDLDGSPGSGGVAQSFATQPNRDYTVSFYLAGNGGTAPAIKTIWVTAAGAAASAQFDTTGTSFTNMKWRQIIWGFRAVAASTTIEFYSGDPVGFGGPGLDNVVVRPASCVCDLNYDAFVNDADFSIFAIAYDQLICPGITCSGDFNFDGLVDDADFSLFAVAYDELLCP